MKMGAFYAPNGQSPLLRALGRLGEERKNQAAALKMLRIQRNVERGAKDFHDAHLALAKQHGAQETPAGGMKVPEERMPAFLEDFRELCEQPVPEYVLAERIRLEELWARGPNGERLELEIPENDLAALEDLLDLEPKAEAPPRPRAVAS